MRHSKIDLLLPFALILIAEALFFLGYPMDCLYVHGLNLVVCVILIVLIEDEVGLLAAYALISLIRIIGLGMPTFFTLRLYDFVPIYSAAIIGAIIVLGEGRPFKEQFRDIGKAVERAWNKVRSDYLFATGLLVIGILMGYLLANLEYQILAPPALIPEFTIEYLIILAIVMVFFVGFGEELMFRAILQRRMQKKLDFWMTKTVAAWIGIILASIIFAAMHSIYLSFPYLLYVFCVGLLLGLSYQWTKSLGFVSLIHGSINFFLFSFLPYGYLRLF
jgi:uncharacterized protein